MGGVMRGYVSERVYERGGGWVGDGVIFEAVL